VEPAELERVEGAIHGFVSLLDQLDVARDGLETVAAGLRGALEP
jgi:acetyl esterase/lipase